jgi:preprotein translocase subunit SecE
VIVVLVFVSVMVAFVASLDFGLTKAVLAVFG